MLQNIANQFNDHQIQMLLEQFVLYLLEDEIQIGCGRDEDGLHTLISNDIYASNDHLLHVKFYSQNLLILKYDFIDDNDIPQTQSCQLNDEHILIIPDKLRALMKTKLEDFIVEFNGY
ncbi:hypothetical protein [Pedobacter soli]|uniref:Uncharacterized protein n=1 Tax=Pedobacter soli TaxID=390242 RepID=A0A1G6VDV9_9SPHI|nr:hypothetical protein [Pedobacter soli]SDD51789.1 hypothetical protein SAMN04488024_106102 [Pedobacter soli]